MLKYETYPKLKYRAMSFTHILFLVDQVCFNFAPGTVVSLPCPVQNIEMIVL